MFHIYSLFLFLLFASRWQDAIFGVDVVELSSPESRDITARDGFWLPWRRRRLSETQPESREEDGMKLSSITDDTYGSVLGSSKTTPKLTGPMSSLSRFSFATLTTSQLSTVSKVVPDSEDTDEEFDLSRARARFRRMRRVDFGSSLSREGHHAGSTSIGVSNNSTDSKVGREHQL